MFVKFLGKKAQLSFEFMLYLLISVIALAGVISMFIYSKSAIQIESTKIFLQQFVSDVNLHTNFYDSSFNVYIPSKACAAKFSYNKLIYNNISFIFNSNISMNWSVLCKENSSILNITLNKIGNNFVLGDNK
ncbi:MAG: hypothetical protein ACP5UN_00915 [Candidatus Micrarchaeia archaeon]